MCESTAVLCGLSELGGLASDVALYQSKRLHRFAQKRFTAYVTRANADSDRIGEHDGVQAPSEGPAFCDPQHGAAPFPPLVEDPDEATEYDTEWWGACTEREAP